jgi:hypothetical protein
MSTMIFMRVCPSQVILAVRDNCSNLTIEKSNGKTGRLRQHLRIQNMESPIGRRVIENPLAKEVQTPCYTTTARAFLCGTVVVTVEGSEVVDLGIS